MKKNRPTKEQVEQMLLRALPMAFSIPLTQVYQVTTGFAWKSEVRQALARLIRIDAVRISGIGHRGIECWRTIAWNENDPHGLQRAIDAKRADSE